MIKNIIGLILSLFFSLSALGGTVNSNFQSNATLGASCVISVPNYNFGNYNPQAVPGFVFQRYIQTCSKGVVGVVSFGGGSSNNVLDRTMVGSVSGDLLHYNIVVSASTTATIIGDGTQGTMTRSSTGTGGGVSSPIGFYYIAPNQYVTPDTYSDNVTVTLTY